MLFAGRDSSNLARISIDHKTPIVTDLSIIELHRDPNPRRPYVDLPGMKSTNSVTLVTGNHRHPVYWDLFNNVIPHVAENRGQNLISSICDGAKNNENPILKTSHMMVKFFRASSTEVQD